MIELFLRHGQSTNDRRLVAWVRLQLIAEDIESMKRNAELRSDPIFIEANSIKSDFALFQERLKIWEKGLDPLLWTGKPNQSMICNDLTSFIESLRLDFDLCKSKLHEFTVYYGEDIHQLDIHQRCSG